MCEDVREAVMPNVKFYCFSGLHLPLLNLPYYLTYLMAGFVALHTVFEIVLELISARYGHIAGCLYIFYF